MLAALNVSVMAIFFPSADDYATSLIISKILVVIGFSGVMLVVDLILSTLPKIRAEQKRQDEH
jgi:hypothetical protein